jgi:hypothetical protein
LLPRIILAVRLFGFHWTLPPRLSAINLTGTISTLLIITGVTSMLAGSICVSAPFTYAIGLPTYKMMASLNF